MSVRIRPVLLGAVLTLALAGPAVAESPYGIRLAQAAREFGDELGREEREATAEFVFGNALYALLHELGHALASEFRLALPARREEAVDSFAALALLSLGDDVPDGVLASAAQGWLLAGEGDRDLAFHRRHRFDRQRAAHLVCVLAGSDAKELRLPEEAPVHQRNCSAEYRRAKALWDGLLNGRLRGPGTPAPRIDLIYGHARPEHAPYRDALRALRLLETVASVAERYALPRRMTIEAMSCGAANALWDAERRRITLCYELAAVDVESLRRDAR